MDFLSPWNSDLNFDYYIRMHEKLIGREWFIEDLSYLVLKTDYRGVLFAAEMGFGKSAIVSNIAYAGDKRLPGYPLYSKLVSIHVCRFDSHITLKPGMFVKNMAAGIAQKFPEYGNIIHLDRMAHDYLFTEKCFEDPQGCFDFGILSPLQKMQGIPDKLIVLMDALDECIEYWHANKFTLLYEKIPRLPKFIKILCTSRNISQIREKLPPGIILYDNPYIKEKSTEDIKQYIEFR
ncbi:protein TANC2-like [Saccostrea cucullata]|uniref:protein TANC2-like n=1 Tax=Saccostrea cuccullata TaxID=36930 RepID=UPI002ED60BCB